MARAADPAVTEVIPALAGIPHVFITKPVDPDMVSDILAIEAERARLDDARPEAPVLIPSAAL